MAEKTPPEKTPADAWPGAYQAATEQLRGIGPNEPQKTRPAIQARVAKAAADHFTAQGVKFARVSAKIIWGHDRPRMTLELITMAGERLEGGATVDPRLSAPVPEAKAPAPVLHTPAPRHREPKVLLVEGDASDEKRRLAYRDDGSADQKVWPDREHSAELELQTLRTEGAPSEEATFFAGVVADDEARLARSKSDK